MERAQETHSKSGPGQGSVQEEGSVVSVAWSGGLGLWKNARATSTTWLPMPKAHGPSQPPPRTTLTSEGTEA